MSAEYITKNHDDLDLICIHHYGYCLGSMEIVLQANPWLANYTGHLPANLKITLPDIEVKPAKNVVRIWSAGAP
ncbi:MAG: tail protein X [Puniceicoccales bacterium]|jgi:phage tail protein X|nr:tail protein X [Puniceicoccales bacterium]